MLFDGVGLLSFAGLFLLLVGFFLTVDLPYQFSFDLFLEVLFLLWHWLVADAPRISIGCVSLVWPGFRWNPCTVPFGISQLAVSAQKRWVTRTSQCQVQLRTVRWADPSETWALWAFGLWCLD